MRPERRTGEAGFSLVELLVAMVITMIISGAIYGLLASGQGAFRREPELSDRQQNIRVAMDLIQRDIENAGMKVPPSLQHFTDGLNAVGIAVPGGGNVDFLELYGNDGACPTLDACKGNTGSSVTTYAVLPGCYNLPSLVLVGGTAGESAVMWAENPGAGTTSACTGSSTNGHAVFAKGKAPRFNPPGGPGFDVKNLSVVQVVRYEVCNDAQGVPNLYRSPTGGVVNTSTDVGPTVSTCNVNPTAYQLVARGIENLQVQYLNGDDGGASWEDTPEPVNWTLASPARENTLVRQVRVTFTARNTGLGNIQGASQPGDAATRFVRGQLTTVTAPRAMLQHLAAANLWQ